MDTQPRKVQFAGATQETIAGRSSLQCNAFMLDACTFGPNCQFSHDEGMRTRTLQRMNELAEARKASSSKQVLALPAGLPPERNPAHRTVSAIMSRRDMTQTYGDGAGSAGRADSDSVEVL